MNAGLNPNPVHVPAYARSLTRLLAVVFSVLLIASAAAAQTSVYTIRGNVGGVNNIWNVNLATGTERLVYTGYPGGNAATLAQRPSDGMLFYSINGTDGDIYRFNPATPNVAPVLLGGVGGAVSGSFRMAFNGATLYYMVGNTGPDANRVYTINQTTGAATFLATVTNTNNGGDMAFSSAGTLYIIDQDLRLCSYAGLPANGAAGGCNTIGVPDDNSIGIAFNASGQLILQTVTNANLYSVNLPGLGFTAITGLSGGNTATGDMASANVPAPNLAITKTDGVTTVYRGGPVTYTIVVTNSGTYTVTGTVTDTIPASVTGVTWNCVASAGSVCGAASGSGNTINTTATLEAGDAATYTVTGTIAAGASGTLTNTANVAVPAWLTDSTPANNTATDVDTINLNANLGITKTDGLANINSGSPVTYTIVVSNAGPDASTGSIVTDTVPASITAVTWTCGGGTGGATCGAASGSGNSINTTANLPSASSVTYTVSGTISPSATGTLSNTARVITPASGVSDPTDLARTGAGNNSATDTTTINAVPDLQIAKSHSGNFTVGVNGTYILTANNAGSANTSGTITVVDNLPAGLTIAAIPTGTGWNCSTTVVGSSTATCTSTTVIAAGVTSPNPITVTVVVAPAAFPSVTNAASISGGNEPASNNGNNSDTDPTTVNGVADVRIAKSHSGNFTVGVNGTYTLTASNAGTLVTSGTITVVDNLPAGLTIASIPTGTGWNCSTTVVGSATATCTSSTVIAAGATSPNPITVNVVVAPAAFPSVTNSATISGGGEPAYNNGNNSTADPTTVNGVPDLTIAKTHVGNFTQGQVGATYSMTATNSGTAATSGTVTVVDSLPAGLTATAISGTGWSCVLGTLTCTRSDALAAGASYPVITLTVTVANNAPASVTNSVSVSGGNEPAYNNGNNTATNPTTINQLPDLTIAKTHVGNFTQGQVGATYSITATNSGSAVTSGTVTVTDSLPAGLTATAISGTGWACVLGTLTCTRSDALAAGASYPVITLTVTVANNAPVSVTNSVSVSGGGQTNTTNDTATNPTTINQLADLTIAKSHVGDFTQGQVGATYSLTATNSGLAATSGTVTVTDTLPAGLTATAISGTGWSCVLGTLTCTRADALAAGASYPVITVTVTVANNAAASVTNSANVSGGGQIVTSNDSDTDPTTINQLPDLTITKSHVGNFIQGQVGATYSITATNSGSAATSGTVTVTDTLPAGLTATAISGTGWSCVLGTLTCTRSDALAAGASYPIITLTVTVATNAPASVTNSVAVSGGGQTNTTNDTATNPTTINQLPDLTITKSHVGNFTQGQVGATYSITATNSGSAATSGTVTVVDTLPTGLTATAISGTGWSCVLGTLTCTRSDALAAGSSYPVITVTVTVANNAAASLTNSASVSGGGQTNTGNDTATDPTTINQLADLTITKTHVGNFTQGQVGATYSITATNSGFAATSGTVTVTDTLPAGLTATAISGTGWSCVLGTLTCTRSDALAPGASYPVITLTVNVANNAPASVINSVSVSGGGQTNTTNDTTTNPTTINQLADLTITKSHVGNFSQGQVGATYSITATNSGFAATSGTVTVVDTLPAGLTATAISGTGWSCVLGTLTCTRSDALAAGSSYPVITVTVNVANNAAASVTNSANVSGGGETNTSNDSVSDPTTITQLADLTVAKSHVGNFTQGQVGATYSITATNSGFAATSGTVTVVDALPAGLTATAISGTGWSCVLGTLTCTRSDALAAGSSYPVITVTVTVANSAAASVTNSVSVSGGGQTNTTNDTASDPTTINQLPDLTITKSHVGNFTQGQVGATYSITATNSGSAATSGTVTVVDTLPAGLTATAISGTGWSCVLGTLTCTRSDALAAGSSYPVITVTVNVANNAPASVTNSVSVSGGGQTNTTNDTATNPTTINQLPDLTITKTHVGNFTQGQVGATYSITATNSGSAATSGTVTVVDTLPAGLTATAISGSGWSCVLGTLTCTRSDALAAGSSYPVITVTVTVANNAPASVTNSVTVSGGGQTNTTNDTATNPTTINQLPDLTITKSHVGNFTQGQVGATYSITATNSGSATTSGTVTVVDTLPAGLTATAISGTGWSCVLGTLTCTRSDALAAGASYPVITVTVNVALSAPATVTNSVNVSGGGQTNTTNDTANDLTNINTAAPPSIGLVKSVSPGGTQIPGTDLLYTIVYTNTGGQPANNFVLVDPNPTNAVPADRVFNNVDFKIGSLTSNPGSSGLVAAFQYSNDGGATWTYTAVSGGGGAPAGYDRNVTNVRWSFAGSLSQTAPNNTGSVTLTVRIR
jgi:uncharacterized repeat protein (TIGR01451 family)